MSIYVYINGDGRSLFAYRLSINGSKWLNGYKQLRRFFGLFFPFSVPLSNLSIFASHWSQTHNLAALHSSYNVVFYTLFKTRAGLPFDLTVFVYNVILATHSLPIFSATLSDWPRKQLRFHQVNPQLCIDLVELEMLFNHSIMAGEFAGFRKLLQRRWFDLFLGVPVCIRFFDLLVLVIDGEWYYCHQCDLRNMFFKIFLRFCNLEHFPTDNWTCSA